jgi:hypothetical protein
MVAWVRHLMSRGAPDRHVSASRLRTGKRGSRAVRYVHHFPVMGASKCTVPVAWHAFTGNGGTVVIVGYDVSGRAAHATLVRIRSGLTDASNGGRINLPRTRRGRVRSGICARRRIGIAFVRENATPTFVI